MFLPLISLYSDPQETGLSIHFADAQDEAARRVAQTVAACDPRNVSVTSFDAVKKLRGEARELTLYVRGIENYIS